MDDALHRSKQSNVHGFKDSRNTILIEDWYGIHYDECFSFRQAKDGHVAVLATYVNDVLFPGEYTLEVQRLQTRPSTKFKNRDLGLPD